MKQSFRLLIVFVCTIFILTASLLLGDLAAGKTDAKGNVVVAIGSSFIPSNISRF